MPPVRLAFTFKRTVIFINISDTNAIITFETGPASAVIAIPVFGFLKFLAFMLTGFAQPIPKSKIPRAPIGSICAMGFKVSLP